MNYTKGEWKLKCGIRDSQGRLIASQNGTSVSPEEEIANAHLILAAPDMYEALRARTYIERHDTPSYKGQLQEVQELESKALAKAEGKEVKAG